METNLTAIAKLASSKRFNRISQHELPITLLSQLNEVANEGEFYLTYVEELTDEDIACLKYFNYRVTHNREGKYYSIHIAR